MRHRWGPLGMALSLSDIELAPRSAVPACMAGRSSDRASCGLVSQLRRSSMMVFDRFRFILRIDGRRFGIDQMIDQNLQERPDKRDREERAEHDELRGQHVPSVAQRECLASKARKTSGKQLMHKPMKQLGSSSVLIKSGWCVSHHSASARLFFEGCHDVHQQQQVGA